MSSTVPIQDPYSLLGLPKNATDSDIRRAFRTLSLKHHPDRGGNADHFRAIQRASEILQDSRLRAAFDNGGEEGLRAASEPHQAPASQQPFVQFGFPFRQRPQVQAKTVIDVDVSLELAFEGGTANAVIAWRKSCIECAGQGTRRGAQKSACLTCQGRGMVIQTRTLGANMIQQIAINCIDCSASGMRLAEGDRCGACGGLGNVAAEETVALPVPKGCVHGQQLFTSLPHIEAIALFRARELPHPAFERRGDHLTCRRTISLLEALTGFRFEITHLDGTKLTALSPPKSVLSPGSLLRLKQRGMPSPNSAGSYGDLIVIVAVEFPTEPPSLEASLLLARALTSSAKSEMKNETTTIAAKEATSPSVRLEKLSSEEARQLLERNNVPAPNHNQECRVS